MATDLFFFILTYIFLGGAWFFVEMWAWLSNVYADEHELAGAELRRRRRLT